MRYFFCKTLNENFITLEKEEETHLFKTLRASVGDQIALIDGKGGVANAIVCENKQLEITQYKQYEEPENKIYLYCAAPRKNKFEILLKAATELGVWEIRLIECERSVALVEKPQRYETMLKEACKQSRNLFMPQIIASKKLSLALEECEKENIQVVLGSVKNCNFSNLSRSTKKIAYFVGPEGGFSELEEELIFKHNAIGLNLGEYVLRLETAAIAGIAVLKHCMKALIFIIMLFLITGCSDGNNHPYIKKARSYRDEGNYKLSEKFYLSSLEKYPYNAKLHIELANLYDESLKNLIGAIYHYNIALSLPLDKDMRETVERFQLLAVARLKRELNNSVDNSDILQKQNTMLRKTVIELQKKIKQLKKE